MGLQEHVDLRLPSPQCDTPSTGECVQAQLSDDSSDSMVAESTTVRPTRADQIIGPTTIQIAGVIGHDFEPDNQQDVARPPQVTHDYMAYLSLTIQDGGLNLKWPDLFKTHGDHPLRDNTLPSGDNGQLGVAERALMQLPLLS